MFLIIDKGNTVYDGRRLPTSCDFKRKTCFYKKSRKEVIKSFALESIPVVRGPAMTMPSEEHCATVFYTTANSLLRGNVTSGPQAYSYLSTDSCSVIG